MQVFLGAAVALSALAALIDGGPARRRLFGAGLPLSSGARVGLMGVLAVLSALLSAPALFPPLRGAFFAFCGACPLPLGGPAEPGPHAGFLVTFLQGTWYYAATVLPVFVVACALSGVLATRRSLRVGGIMGAFGLAAVLPVCSCGVVPLGRAMIDRGGASVRAGLMFIATAPLLSPIIVGLGASVLGWRYVGIRIGASFIMGVAVALIVPAFLPAGSGLGRGGSEGQPLVSAASEQVSGSGCVARQADRARSALASGWQMLLGLLRYVLYGVVAGAALSAALPPGIVATAIGAGPLSLAASVVVGVPINLCAGEEVLLTAPFAEMGFTMGHAIAFALAGTGICLSSLPLLRAALGARAMMIMVALHLVVPFALGIGLAALPLDVRADSEGSRDYGPALESLRPDAAESLIDKSG